jgi:hypothetical protein
MMTFGNIKHYISPFVEGGVCPDDPRVKRTVDEAIERLVQKPSLGYRMLLRHIRMPLRGSYVTLPRCVDKLISARIDSRITGVYSKWYEFMDNGPGPESMAGLDLVDLGEMCTQYEIPDSRPMYLVVNSDRPEEDDGARIHVRGLDPTGREVRDPQNRVGEILELQGASAVKSYSTFVSVNSISKPVTKGYVFLSALDPATGEMYTLACYSPSETTPSYRRYQINGLGYNEQDKAFTAEMQALVKLRPVEITDDSDVLLITNRAALKIMCQAIYYYNTGDAERGGAYEATAERLLAEETINTSQPSQDTAAVQVMWGAGEIPGLL